MGNAAIRKVPEDLTKCTEAQLRVMINSVIINNPWNDDENQSEEDSLNETIAMMEEKGFRPITPAEYVQELKRQRREKAPHQGIKVWLPIEGQQVASWSAESKERRSSESGSSRYSGETSPVYASSCSVSHGSKESYSYGSPSSLHQLQLPLSREDAASEIMKSGSSAAMLSEISQDEVDTEEWPTHGVKQAWRQQQAHSQRM